MPSARPAGGRGLIRRGPTRLGDEHLALREIRPADADDLFRWRTQPRVRELFHTSGPSSRELHATFVEQYFSSANEDAWFVIEAEGRAVGSLAFYRRLPPGAGWEAGRIVLDPSVRGLRALRWARQAIALLMVYARASGHASMACEVLAGNRVMLSIVRSVGFRETRRGGNEGREYVVLTADLTALEVPTAGDRDQ